MDLKRRLRFSLATLLCATLLLASAILLWRNWSPWVVERSLYGHRQSRWRVMYSPDGKRIVTSGSESYAIVWDAESGKEIVRLTGHTNAINYAAFSPDGKRIVTTSSDGSGRIWSAESGAEEIRLASTMRDVGFPAFSPDGRRIVVGYNDSNELIWDARSGKVLASLPEVGSGHHYAALSPDGRRIVTAEVNGTFTIWDLTDTLEKSPVKLDSISPQDGVETLWKGGDNKKTVLDLAKSFTLAPIRRRAVPVGPDGAWLQSMSFSSDSRRIVTAGSTATARIWDAETGAELAALQGHKGSIGYAVFSPDCRSVATAGEDGTLRLWDVEGSRELACVPGLVRCYGPLTFSHDGKCLAEVGWLNDHGVIFDGHTGQPLLELPKCTAIAFSPNGAHVAVAYNTNGAPLDIYVQRRPDTPYGVLVLPELWLTVLFAAAFLWSLWRDRRAVVRVSEVK